MKLSPVFFQTSRAIAAVMLAIIPVTSKAPRWWLLIALGGFIVLSEVFSTRIENVRSTRIQKIQRRALRVIADLASVAGERYDFWVVDIYLPGWSWSRSKGIRRELKRTLSLTLTDVQNVPTEVSIAEANPLARCYRTRQQLLWADSKLNAAPSAEDSCLSSEHNDQLSGTYGAVSVNPLVNETGHNCRGILLVHTKPDPELVTTAFGILNSSLGRRHVAEACHDIHGDLS